jgi:hypothetical protein
LFAGLSVLPAATYLAGQFPDWSWMYLIDPQRLPRLWAVGAGLVTGGGVAAGFVLGLKGFRRYGAWSLGAALAVLLLAYLGLVGLSWRSSRLSAIGSYANFHAGGWLMQPLLTLAPTSQPELGARPAGLLYALLAINLWLAAALWLVARTLRQKSEFILAMPPAPPPPSGLGPSGHPNSA